MNAQQKYYIDLFQNENCDDIVIHELFDIETPRKEAANKECERVAYMVQNYKALNR